MTNGSETPGKKKYFTPFLEFTLPPKSMGEVEPNTTTNTTEKTVEDEHMVT